MSYLDTLSRQLAGSSAAMRSSYTYAGHKSVCVTVHLVVLETKLTVDTGPIFDAYDIKVLVIPGCVGIVASIMLFSISQGLSSHGQP